MLVKLSSKGQLVIPKRIRQALRLKAGAEFEVELVDGRIILEPVLAAAEVDRIIVRLQDLAAGADLTKELEIERRWEIERERKHEHTLRTG
jgi:AbrB family looped-hinge helix DNA binding protein